MGIAAMARRAAAALAAVSSTLLLIAIACVFQQSSEVGFLSSKGVTASKYSMVEVMEPEPMHASDEGDCVDSENWRHGKHTCKWVAWEKTPGRRCALKDCQLRKHAASPVAHAQRAAMR